MATPLIPQEIYLLERYSSLPYVQELRYHFNQVVQAAEDALTAFMQNIPADYRSRPLNQQPDIVWGERVLPNIRWVNESVHNACQLIAAGQFGSLGCGSSVTNALNAINRDYDTNWMDKRLEEVLDAHWIEAARRAGNIGLTSQGGWGPTDLTTDYHEPSRGPLNPPASWPVYRLNAKVRVKSDDKVPVTGIYLPDIDDSAAQFMVQGNLVWDALTLRDPNDPQRLVEHKTMWTLVERIADSGGGIPGKSDPDEAGALLRCLAGKPCPRAGYWMTPAKTNSRRQFKRGEVMPDMDSLYGATIWQWDVNQG
jgi:hypothetical protein